MNRNADSGDSSNHDDADTFPMPPAWVALLDTDHDPLYVRCEVCGADEFELCTDLNLRHVLDAPHHARVLAAMPKPAVYAFGLFNGGRER